MKASAGKILMLLENAFPQDSRVSHEAFHLSSLGYQVTIIAQRWKDQSFKETLKGVRIFRIPEVNLFKKSNLKSSRLHTLWYNLVSTAGYIFEYFYFTLGCFLLSLFINLRYGFQVLHLHNPPNTLVFIAAFYRLFGKKFVFDHHDLSAELFLSRYGKKGGLIYRYLLFEEKVCLRLANLIIATNESYKAIDMARGKRSDRDIFVVRNGPSKEDMKPPIRRRASGKMNKNLLVYIGIMGPQDGVDYLLNALAHLIYKLNRKDVHTVIIGTGDSLPDLRIMCSDLGLDEYVRFTGYIPKSELLSYLSAADICLDPNPSNPLNDYSTWIKVMEYMSFGKPMVSFDLKETRYSAREAAVYVEPNNIEEYAVAIRDLLDDPIRRTKMGRYGYQRVWSELSWEHVSKNLTAAYQTLFNPEY
ncbi:MAG: glycosyltransferase family 4 protein [bacterium]|nr:MAG: glycosyltransferase family 4 protein [bacterium]